jgi:hypothetical protein
VDATLDFYRHVTDVIRGRVKSAASFEDLQAALNGLLGGVWLSLDPEAGYLRGVAVLRPDEATGEQPLPLAFRAPDVPSDMPTPPWLRRAELDATP